MHLTQSTDLALRVLMLLGARNERRSAAEMAERLRVAPQHMAKIVQRLRRDGFVSTTRGRGGGVVLADGVTDLPVGEIVRVLEGPGEAVECDSPPCPLRGGCRLRGVLRAAQAAFLASLDQVRLRELVADPTGPVLLSLAPPASAGAPTPAEEGC
ncbi:RrF2 family transcriptional regulator [Actinomadura citrea]|uniref:Rrf2 family nitric oxide-sensitive transcriptional repressor n=1 Tax=Actinomadura citrea TaxID=46158 RepID=A0A7Y9GDP7_9ACTN|nr:Rrf2 family transcriptional regulator [Actinomadura citrea]NYE14581.1 Rrf2 family nitric oxide-sensitive transcriptional repressor [Actinomadura citrea]GGU09588.1 HTH-type transcriptional repressor NsrR [Actinomadura citrea]